MVLIYFERGGGNAHALPFHNDKNRVGDTLKKIR